MRDLHVWFAGRIGLWQGLRGVKPVDARAVDGVNLELYPGEVLALAGESGCGKTTLARTVMGLERPGPATSCSRASRSDAQRPGTARVPAQGADGLPGPDRGAEPAANDLRVDRRGAARPRHHPEFRGRIKEQLVARALSRAGMRPPERFFLNYPHELSGGQRQRVVIAGALVLDPEIVADEPVSSLDASVRGEIAKLLLGLRNELNIAMLVVTHDLGLAWTIAGRVAVMYLGRIVESGPPRAMLTDPIHPYTKALLEVVPEAGGIDRPFLAGEPPDPTSIPPGCRFNPRCPAVASGAAEAAGVLPACLERDLGSTSSGRDTSRRVT